jgi:hypothetical protein
VTSLFWCSIHDDPRYSKSIKFAIDKAQRMGDIIKEETVSAPLVALDPRWRLIAARDCAADGKFYYSVKTTGVYCRPSCTSRLTNPKNERFHATSEDAEKAGFGTPCIIEIAVPVSAIPYHSVARGLLYEYGRRRNIPYPEASNDTAREPMRVLRVIQNGSPEFASRTHGISWHTPIHP